MAFDDVYLVTTRLATVSAEQVRAAEETLKVKFPKDYSEFVTKFGEGTYSGFVRVYPPERIFKELREVQQRWDEYFLWDEGPEVLTKAEVVESIVFADTVNGDELIFHPGKPNRLFLLPRHSYSVLEVADSLSAAIDWLCASGKLTAPIGFKYFESWLKRKRGIYVGAGKFEIVCEALTQLDIHDHIENVTEEEDLFFKMFVSDFHGTVAAMIDDETVTVILWHDADAANKSLSDVIACLDNLGLQRQSRGEEK
ncbi:MAG: hypothetical protein FD138_4076 [Planctomycetota bacterium]|nr:MAG: hypothetical protein FD138_4076 [Planctomycetota bacterium]